MLRTFVALTLLAATAAMSHAQWQLHDAHSTADLRGVDNVGGGVAWASGSGGTVLRTEDAGIVWQLCAIPPGGAHLDFRAIQAFDKNTAIIMSIGKGDQSRLFKTTDGCQSWKLIFINPDPKGFWDAIRFTNPGDGWLIGDPSHGRHTVLHFQLQRDPSCKKAPCAETAKVTDESGPTLNADADLQGSFAASNEVLFVFTKIQCNSNLTSPAHGKTQTTPLTETWFATGGKGGAFVYRQNMNCGKLQYGDPASWEKTAVPVGSTLASAGVFAIDFQYKEVGQITQMRGVAVGGDYLKPEDGSHAAAFTPSGGHDWTAAATQPHGFRSAVDYDAKTNTWVAVGPNGTDISTDDGRNWRALKPDAKFNDAPDADQHWNAISLPYAVGPHGRIGTLRAAALQPASN